MAKTIHQAAPRRQERALLALVIGLGVLIVLGVAVLVGAMVAGVGGQKDKAGFGTRNLNLPPDAELGEMQLTEKRLVLRVRRGGRDMLIFLDPQNGQEIGKLYLR